MEYRLSDQSVELVDERSPLPGGRVVFSLGPHDVLAVLWDDVNGILLKHGPAGFVRADRERIMKGMEATGLMGDEIAGLRMVEIPVANLTPEILGEISACINTSMRVSGLDARLAAMAVSPSPEIPADDESPLP